MSFTAEKITSSAPDNQATEITENTCKLESPIILHGKDELFIKSQLQIMDVC